MSTPMMQQIPTMRVAEKAPGEPSARGPRREGIRIGKGARP